MAAAQPLSTQQVADAFVKEYYDLLHHKPYMLYKFYEDISMVARQEEDGTMSFTTTLNQIKMKFVSLKYDNLRTVIKSVDAQESFKGGVHVLVTGCLHGKDIMAINFAQTFFLAPQDSIRGYYVLDDVFRYVEDDITLGKPSVYQSSTKATNCYPVNQSSTEAADGYAIYLKWLPANANAGMLHDVFKKFGPIKKGGIQVLGTREYFFGLVEFEVASAVQEALEASPVSIAGCQVEVKRPPISAKMNLPSKEMDQGIGDHLQLLIICVYGIVLAIWAYLLLTA